MHGKGILLNDETIDSNLIHFLCLFDAELQELDEEILFPLNSMELSGDLNKKNVINEALNGAEKELCKKSEICRSE